MSGEAPVERHAVSRSPLRMWLLALAGVPMVVIGVDVLLEQRIFRPIQEALFPPDSPQIFEQRDYIWAWVLLMVGAVLVLWGLKELIRPATVVATDESGLLLRLAGPFRPASTVAWSKLGGVRAESFDDGGEAVPAMVVELVDAADLPEDPWGARWVDATTLAVLAAGWDKPAPEVVLLIEQAREAAEVARIEAESTSEGTGTVEEADVWVAGGEEAEMRVAGGEEAEMLEEPPA